jgi:hypothetical protein
MIFTFYTNESNNKRIKMSLLPKEIIDQIYEFNADHRDAYKTVMYELFLKFFLEKNPFLLDLYAKRKK